MTQQEAFTASKDAWNGHNWQEDETAEWFVYCKLHPIKNQLGEVCYMFPYIAFQSVNILRLLNGDPVIFTPDW